jgi:cell division protein FtsI/penicillin-binding protein 2
MVSKTLTSPRANQEASRRITVLVVFLCAAFSIILARLFFLQVVTAKNYQQLADDQHSSVRAVTPVRGTIKVVDRFSAEPYAVATSIEKNLVYAVPSSIKDDQALAKALAPVLQMTEEAILEKIADKSKKYAPLKKQLSEEEEKQIKELKLSGIYMEPETVRYYPEGAFLSQVLGYVGFKEDMRTGYYGLEQAFEQALAGQAGSIDQEKDASGTWIFGARRNIKPAINGDNLILTIDKTIQFKAESVLKEAVERNEADSGSLLIMDPKTGAILTMANYPTFDPNNYSKVSDIKVFNNTATVGNYEPGSIFKPITMAASIDQGKITPDTTYTDTGSIEIDGYTIKNSDLKAHGLQTMTQVLEQSLNTGVIFAKDQIGNAKFLEYIKKFGFGERTGLEVPEAKGDLSNLIGNIKVNYHTASFGQGLSVTPIQLMQAFGALANKGKMMQPYLVQSQVDATGKVTNTEPKELRQVVSERTASMVGAMMTNVVENGHGKRAAVPGYYVAGKTGTAQVPRKDGRGYEANNNIGSFIGYAPVEDPKFVILVRINHPRTVSFAESSAAPSFGQMAQFLMNYYNIAPSRSVKK